MAALAADLGHIAAGLAADLRWRDFGRRAGTRGNARAGVLPAAPGIGAKSGDSGGPHLGRNARLQMAPEGNKIAGKYANGPGSRHRRFVVMPIPCGVPGRLCDRRKVGTSTRGT